MWVLGLSGYGHDSAAAIICDGVLVAAAEEERFTGVKHDGRLPVEAARWACAAAGRRWVDRVAFYHRPFQHAGRRLAHVLRHLPASRDFLVHRSGDVRGWGEMLALRGPSLCRRLGLSQAAPLTFVDHHRCHGFDAVAMGRASEAAVLTIDGMGEWATTRLAHFGSGHLQPLSEVPFPHSLGLFWEAVTEHLGFRPHGDEYKVMGLAAYGEPDFSDVMERMVATTSDGHFRLDLDFFQHHVGARPIGSETFSRVFGPPRIPGDVLNDRHRALAASAQARLQDVVLHMTQRLREDTGASDLCLGGGVALNCALNGWLVRNGPFERIHVSPAPNDAGAAVGAARSMFPTPAKESGSSVFVGPPADGAAVRRLLASRGDLRIVETDDAISETARRIAEGAVVGWFHGPMEFGPRALGNRSILADPRRSELRDYINAKVKGRESFRPLAASVLQEHAEDMLELPWPSPHMLFAFPVRSPWRSRVPGVVHVDGTCRVQTVGAEDHRPYRRLLEEFHRLTGIPAVLNTSLNTAGDPIAREADEAMRVFDEGALDAIFTPAGLVTRAEVASPQSAVPCR